MFTVVQNDIIGAGKRRLTFVSIRLSVRHWRPEVRHWRLTEGFNEAGLSLSVSPSFDRKGNQFSGAKRLLSCKRNVRRRGQRARHGDTNV